MVTLKKLALFALLFVTFGCSQEIKNPTTPVILPKACGVERWAVKTLTDSTYSQIDFNHVKEITVRELTEMEAPDSKPETTRVKPVETSVWRIHAYLLGYKFERAAKSDQDFHLILADRQKDKNDHWITMIGEIPDPPCANQKYADQFGNLRTLLQTMGKPKGTKVLWFDKPIPVLVEGVGFFDKLHGQDGVAPNGIELHPILNLEKDTEETDIRIQFPEAITPVISFTGL